VRLGLAWLVVILGSLPARAAELDLRPPQTEVEVVLEPRARPAKVRVFWSCYAADLGAAARSWLHARAARPDCAGSAQLLDERSDALASALETAARGRVLGDPRKGEVRELDARPGRQRQLTAGFCYAEPDVEQITAWTRRQLAALCE
jgi:hypothetical protein